MQFGNSFTAPLARDAVTAAVADWCGAGADDHASGTLNLMSFIGIIMLMGLVAKNCHSVAGRQRGRTRALPGIRPRRGTYGCRPCALAPHSDDHLCADRRHVASGHWSWARVASFTSPLAVAIIGGTITSTVLTLLVVPSFYDSIEIARDRMFAKFQRRVPRFTALGAFLMTFCRGLADPGDAALCLAHAGQAGRPGAAPQAHYSARPG